jgi:predicted kinase
VTSFFIAVRSISSTSLIGASSFGNDFYNDPNKDQAHNERHTKIEELMWDTARKLLQLGVNVIFDFGCRAKEERDNFRMKAHSATVRKAK